jgi:hypothetical protein
LVATLAAVACLVAPASAGATPFSTGLMDPSWLQPASVPADLNAEHAIGGSYVRELLRWAFVAPASKPAGFNPANPGDPHYRWAAYDQIVRTAAANNLNLILTPIQAPTWAEGPNKPNNASIGAGAWDPDPTAFAQFMQAAATRYSGNYPDPMHPGTNLPRVRFWEIWNEENLPPALAAPNLVEEYRSLLDVAYAAVKAVSPSNRVIIGGLAPLSANPPLSISPIPFIEQLLCVTSGPRGKFGRGSSCPAKANFDALGFHPYTFNATPTYHDPNPNDFTIADTGRLQAVLRAADRLHTDSPNERHQLWATEWSWFTSPPSTTYGDPNAVAARYVNYSMWLLWHNNVPVVIWFLIQDPANTSAANEDFVPGGGLYWSSGQPKLTERAFSFPLIASVSHRRAYVWGRVPTSQRVRVLVQRAYGHRWRTVKRVWTGGSGVFVTRFRTRGNAFFRGYVAHGPVSLSYWSGSIPATPTQPG